MQKKILTELISTRGLRFSPRNVINSLNRKLIFETDRKWKGKTSQLTLKFLIAWTTGFNPPIEEHNFYKFWIYVFKAYKEFRKQLHVDNVFR